MKKIKLLLAMSIFFLGVNVNAYDYVQILTAYNGGIIGSLNNCGVNLSANPKYLRGAGSISLQSPGTKFLSITAMGETGIISSVNKYNEESGVNVYYSPDGLNLNGGGNTILLGYIPPHDVYQAGPTERYSVGSIITTEIKDENKALVLAPFNPTAGFGDSGNRLMVVSSSQQEGTLYSVDSKFIGYANGNIYSQKESGEIYSYASIDDLLLKNPEKYIETSITTIKAIKAYNDGILTLAGSGLSLDGSLYYSKSSDKLLTGADVENIYSTRNGTIKKMEVIITEVNKLIPIMSSDITIFIPLKKQMQNIILAHNDGEISWNGETIIEPVDVQALKSYLAQSLGLSANAKIVKSDILNYDESKTYGSGFFVGEGVDDATMAIAVGLNGLPATVEIKDKGWDGFEYKWRSKGERTGAFNHEYSGEIIGSNEMKVIANHSCTAVVSVTDTNLTPFEFNYSLDASFGIISGYNDTSVGPEIQTFINTGWPVVDHYLTACTWLEENKSKVDIALPGLVEYGCPHEPVDWLPTAFDPKGGSQFRVENDRLDWVR